jgi:predicted ABC-type ATPase
MEGNGSPTLWLVGGANGVGKTTFALARIAAVSGVRQFVNLDLIAKGLAPLDPDLMKLRAARVALATARDLISGLESFSLESTLSGQSHFGLIRSARQVGMKVKLLYFFVSSPEECIRRVARRVGEGGHDVPEADIRRRWTRSLALAPSYAAASDFWRIYDGNGREPVTAAEGRSGSVDYDAGLALPERLDRFIRAGAGERADHTS